MQWNVVMEKAIRPDGSLFFPQKLTREFLESAKRTMGSYLFANQYMNEVIPAEEKRFKDSWWKTYEKIPSRVNTFGFIDPAIGQKNHHDYTAVVVVSVDCEANWYVRVANRYRLDPTQILAKAFEVCDQFKLQALGIESQAYQESLLYFAAEQMRATQKVYPITGVKRGPQDNKDMRILSLVPRFEWSKIFVAPDLRDLREEYDLFPRASHDDLLDALQSIEEIVFYPEKEKPNEQAPAPNSTDYESWYIRNLKSGRGNQE